MFESSSFSQEVLHIHRWVHVRFLAQQEHLCDEQSVLHWHLTISIIAFGAGRTSVVVGLSWPCGSHVLMDQEMSGEKWQLGPTHAWICTRMIRCRSAPTVGRSLSFSAMFSQKRCHRSSGMLDILIPLGHCAEQTNLANDVNTSSDSSASSQSLLKAVFRHVCKFIQCMICLCKTIGFHLEQNVLCVSLRIRNFQSNLHG